MGTSWQEFHPVAQTKLHLRQARQLTRNQRSWWGGNFNSDNVLPCEFPPTLLETDLINKWQSICEWKYLVILNMFIQHYQRKAKRNQKEPWFRWRPSVIHAAGDEPWMHNSSGKILLMWCAIVFEGRCTWRMVSPFGLVYTLTYRGLIMLILWFIWRHSIFYICGLNDKLK